jgi:hypothetical protein
MTTETPMTKEEAISKYGNVPLLFGSYYKYSFAFQGKADDGASVYMTVGGCADDIYKLQVNADEQMTIKYPDAKGIVITAADGTKLFEHWDW